MYWKLNNFVFVLKLKEFKGIKGIEGKFMGFLAMEMEMEMIFVWNMKKINMVLKFNIEISLWDQ